MRPVFIADFILNFLEIVSGKIGCSSEPFSFLVSSHVLVVALGARLTATHKLYNPDY
jgi:hypothetical protein